MVIFNIFSKQLGNRLRLEEVRKHMQRSVRKPRPLRIIAQDRIAM
jgi:hypothetical protein